MHTSTRPLGNQHVRTPHTGTRRCQPPFSSSSEGVQPPLLQQQGSQQRGASAWSVREERRPRASRGAKAVRLRSSGPTSSVLFQRLRASRQGEHGGWRVSAWIWRPNLPHVTAASRYGCLAPWLPPRTASLHELPRHSQRDAWPSNIGALRPHMRPPPVHPRPWLRPRSTTSPLTRRRGPARPSDACTPHGTASSARLASR